MFVSRRDPTGSVLWVEDGSLRLRRWLPGLIAADGITRIRRLGIVDVPVPWYAAVAFSPIELAESLDAAAAAAEMARRLDRSTGTLAAWLGRRGVPTGAETRTRPFAETVLTRARETSAALILLGDDGRRAAALRAIIERAESSVLLVRDRSLAVHPS